MALAAHACMALDNSLQTVVTWWLQKEAMQPQGSLVDRLPVIRLLLDAVGQQPALNIGAMHAAWRRVRGRETSHKAAT